MSEARNLNESITITETFTYTAIIIDGCEVDIKKQECSLNVAFITGNGRKKGKRVIICGDLYDNWTDDDEYLFNVIKEHSSTIIHEPKYLVKIGTVVEETVAEEAVAEEAVAEEAVAEEAVDETI